MRLAWSPLSRSGQEQNRRAERGIVPDSLCVQKFVSLGLLDSAVVSAYLLIHFLFHEILSASSLTHASF